MNKFGYRIVSPTVTVYKYKTYLADHLLTKRFGHAIDLMLLHQFHCC